MNDLGYHIRMSLADGRVIATSSSMHRRLARSVLAAGESKCLLSFRSADTHLHLAAGCSRVEAGALVRVIGFSLHHQLELPVGFTQSYFEPIRDQRHLNNAFWYDFRQDERHGIDIDPHAEASNLPDLLGLRLIGRYTAVNVGRFLPRVQPEQLARRLGISMDELLRGPISPSSIEQLADAAAASVAVPVLRGRAAEVVAARRAAVHLLDGSVPSERLAQLLGTTSRNVRRLRLQPADPLLVEAVTRQLRLRTALDERARSVRRASDALLLGRDADRADGEYQIRGR